MEFPVLHSSGRILPVNFCKGFAAKSYGTYLFTRALEASKESEADEHIKWLERLCKQKTRALKEDYEFISINNSAVLMGNLAPAPRSGRGSKALFPTIYQASSDAPFRRRSRK